MTVSDMQTADAAFLFVISACCLVLVSEDKALNVWQRLTIAAVGFAAFAQAIWLIGTWTPALTFPWARLMLDGAICSASIVRVWRYAITCLGRAVHRATPEFHFPHVHHLDPEHRRRHFGG